IEHKMGLHASDTASIALEDVEVGEDGLLGSIGEGFKVAMSSLDSGRYSVAAGCVGICRGCVEESVRYATEREQFGRPIASFQLIQAMIADMKVKTDASRMLVWRAGWLKDQGQLDRLETSIAELHPSQAPPDAAVIGVLGAGTMGAGIAQLAARSGARTLLFDPISEALAGGLAKASAGLEREAARGRLDAAEARAAAGRLRAVEDLAALAP